MTRFHPGNLAFFEVKEEATGSDYADADEIPKPAHNPNKQTNIVKTIGRGKKLALNQDDSFIQRQIANTLGSGHRAESIFNSSSSKTENSLDGENNNKADTSPPSSLQFKELVDGPADRVTLRPRLVQKKENKSKQDAGKEDQVVTEKDDGKEQAGKKELLRNIASSSYFPASDYGNYDKLLTPAWWGDNFSTAMDRQEKRMQVEMEKNG